MARTRRSDLGGPGIRRRRAGRGFVYVDETGRRITGDTDRDGDLLARIRALAVPPAWTNVWICPWPNGHIQAVGTDVKGRRQYRYHDDWRLRRDHEKFDRMLEFATVLPDLRAHCAAELEAGDMTRERVLACAVHLLDVGFFRIGGEEYADENGSYGLATLERSHAHISGDTVIFEYPAKSGQQRIQAVVDPQVRSVVATLKRRRSGGPGLLAYRNGRGWADIRGRDINEHIRATTRLDVTAKDFRTWNATVLAAVALGVSWPAKSQTARKRAIRRAVTEVAHYLGNTPAVCRSSYIDPRVIDLYWDGMTVRPALDRIGDDPDAALATHGQAERAVLKLLRAHRP